MTNERDRSVSVQSVDRAAALLELLADAGGQTTLTELADRTGLPLPTIHRLIRTLVNGGYVRQLPDRRYGLGPKLIRLGAIAGRQLGVNAHSYLVGLAAELGETANLAILDRDMVAYIAQAESRQSMRMFTEVGRRVHTHCTGVGKAVLSQLDEGMVRDLVASAGMPRATTRSIVEIDPLLAELAQIRTRGYAVDDGEQEVGVRCFAVPVPDAPIPTAVSVSGPDSRVTDEFGERAIPLLHTAAAQIRKTLISG